MKDQIISELKKNRPTLADSSIKTYTSILFNLHKKVFGVDEEGSVKDFDHVQKVLAFLKDYPSNRRKTVLSALVILTNEPQYRTLMNEDVVDYNHEIAKQECSDAQKDNWVTQDQIRQVFDTLGNHANLIFKKKSLKPFDLQQIQDYVLLAVASGIFIPPRRLTDWTLFKIRNVHKSDDNYLGGTSARPLMVMNTYKTSKTYGQQLLEIPKDLKNILSKWIKINPTDYLFFDTNMNPLNSVKLNQRFNKIFGGARISTNNFRHSYLTHKFGHTIQLDKDIDETMNEMGSSNAMLSTYVKKVH